MVLSRPFRPLHVFLMAKTLFPSTLGDDVFERDMGMRTDRILQAGGWPVSGSVSATVR